MKNEHPIIFNTEMVKAILNGNKTQTRRIIKLPKKAYPFQIESISDIQINDFYSVLLTNDTEIEIKCPYGKVGDILYVREKFIGYWKNKEKNLPCMCDYIISYRAGGNKIYRTTFLHLFENHDRRKWKPSIHMPKWVARLFLEITNIRVERIQDITENDAMKEGTTPTTTPHIPGKGRTYIQGFGSLWNSINEKRGYGWKVNPWVWAVEFKIIKK